MISVVCPYCDRYVSVTTTGFLREHDDPYQEDHMMLCQGSRRFVGILHSDPSEAEIVKQ